MEAAQGPLPASGRPNRQWGWTIAIDLPVVAETIGDGGASAMGDAAAWAQAWVSGAAILASSAIAVFVPWNERRVARNRQEQARLSVYCLTSEGDGLEVLVSYRPEFHHHALSVTLSLLEPADARVYKGEVEPIGEGATKLTGRVGGLAQNVRYNGVPLIKRSEEFDGPFQGFLYVLYPDERRGPFKAKVKITILGHGNYIIAERTLQITPQNVDFWPNGAPHAVFKGMQI